MMNSSVRFDDFYGPLEIAPLIPWWLWALGGMVVVFLCTSWYMRRPYTYTSFKKKLLRAQSADPKVRAEELMQLIRLFFRERPAHTSCDVPELRLVQERLQEVIFGRDPQLQQVVPLREIITILTAIDQHKN